MFQNGASKNQHQDSYQRETVPNKFVFFSKLVRQKKSIGWAKYVYVCVWDMCWRTLCNFSPVTRKCESRSKIALFSNERHFEIWFPKKRTITFFWSKLSKLHKKDPILHVAITFSLKQRETRTGYGPIPHPLIHCFLYQCGASDPLRCQLKSLKINVKVKVKCSAFRGAYHFFCSYVARLPNMQSCCKRVASLPHTPFTL